MKRCIVTMLVLSLAAVSFAGDLGTLADLRQALMDDLGNPDTTKHWSTVLLNREINRAVAFVEEALEQQQVILEFTVTPGVFTYALGDTVAEKSVKAAYILPAASDGALDVQGLAYREMSEFGATKLSEPKFYYTWGNTLIVAAPPTTNGTLYVMARLESSDLGLDTSSVQVEPGAKRELVVGYALVQALKNESSQQRRALAQSEFQEWLTKFQIITGIQIKQPEPLGIEEQ